MDKNRTVSLCTFQLHMHVEVPVAVGSKLNNISVETNLSCIQCTFSLVIPFLQNAWTDVMFLPTLCLQQERKKDKEKIKKRKENDLPGAVMQINKWVPVTIIKSHCRLG